MSKNNALIIPDDFKSKHEVTEIIGAINSIKQAETSIKQYEYGFVKSFIISADEVLKTIPYEQQFLYEIPELHLFTDKHLRCIEENKPYIDLSKTELADKLKWISDDFQYEIYIVDWTTKTIRICWDNDIYNHPEKPNPRMRGMTYNINIGDIHFKNAYEYDLHVFNQSLNSEHKKYLKQRKNLILELYKNVDRKIPDEFIPFLTQFIKGQSIDTNIPQRIITVECKYNQFRFKINHEFVQNARFHGYDINNYNLQMYYLWETRIVENTIKHTFSIDTNSYIKTETTESIDYNFMGGPEKIGFLNNLKTNFVIDEK